MTTESILCAGCSAACCSAGHATQEQAAECAAKAKWRRSRRLGDRCPACIPKQGFAAMEPEKRLMAQKRGGCSIPANRRAFSRWKRLAAKAGKKSSDVRRVKRAAGG